jgi:hypothetical protein
VVLNPHLPDKLVAPAGMSRLGSIWEARIVIGTPCFFGGNRADLGSLSDDHCSGVVRDAEYFKSFHGAKKVYRRSPNGVWTEIDAFADPYAVAVQVDRTLFVADYGDRNVWRLTPQ